MSVGIFENNTESAETAREESGFPALAALAMIGLAAIGLRKRRE
jgi:LPXTG-motif cell wall-anchored protein